MTAHRRTTRARVPATLWATGTTALDFTQPWPTPILTRAIREFTAPGDRVILLPIDSFQPGTAAPGFSVVDDADRIPILAGVGADREPAPARLIITELVRPDTDRAALREVIEWAATRLAGNGLLVVPAHTGRTRHGLLADPTGALVGAAQAADLLYLQHIIAAPVDGDHILTRPPTGSGPQRSAHAHALVHADVLVFLQVRDQHGVLPAPGAAAA
ncbi:hypothetical protein GZH49_12235 [Nocardia terpenica]|uniref:hypothetical protein n=1 Tax=Nocardia terpenica TaxID=455432 RepID=UPI002FE1F88A